MRYSTYVRGMVAGMAGGVAATAMMYLSGAGIFAALGWPANTSFLMIGNSAAAFFARLGVALTGGVSLGIGLYCLIGLALGVTFGIALVRLERGALFSLKKRVVLSILFVEVMSLPLRVAAVLALKMSAAGAVMLFSLSIVDHLVYGLVLGVITSYGIGNAARYKPAKFAL